MPDATFLIAAGAATLLGSAVQGSVGLGLGLVAAPVVALIDPSLMPGAVLIVTATLPLLMIGTEWRHIDFRGVSWALLGRVVGNVGGVWVVATLNPDGLAVALGCLILVAVAVTVRSIRFRATPRTLAAAGLVSGVTGTATSIGGPPIALVYQHDPGPRIRATLSAYFGVAVLMSIGMLVIGGQMNLEQTVAGLWLIPFVVLGFFVAGSLKRHVDGGKLRAVLLVVVAISGVTLIVEPIFS